MDQEKDYIEEIFFDYMPLFVPTGSFVPNDKYYQKPTSRSSPYQWNLYKIKTEDGWNLRTPPVLGAGVTVAVIDDGCEINSHPDLPANAFVANKGVTITYTTLQYIGGAALQNESHGTQCAGIIGARCNNNTEGIAGIAGQCQIMPIRVEAYNDLSISAAIGYASSNGARIISMSFGGEPASPLAYSTQDVRHAVTEAFAQKNVVLCAATMNNGGENFIPYPAAYPEVIACGASDPNDKRWALSNYGEDTTSGGIVSVVAPGMDIPTTANIGQGDSGDPNYTGEWSGTSAATPHVAALAALMISANPNLTSQEVKDYIEQTADKVPDISYYLQTKPNGPWGPEHGYGRVNVYKALQKALGGASSPAAPTGLRVN
jgi:subtilisin family serine protease